MIENLQVLLGLIAFIVLVAVAVSVIYHRSYSLINSKIDSREHSMISPKTDSAQDRFHDVDSEKSGSAESKADSIQQEVARKYRSLVPKKKRSFQSICFPKEFELSSPQKFIGSWMGPTSKAKELLAVHGIGSGKTCAAIQAVLAWLRANNKNKIGRPMVVAGASLIPGFRDELRGPCAGDRFVKPPERKILADPGRPDYAKTLAAVDARIDSEIILLSYNKFLEFLRGNIRIGRDTAKTIRVPLLVVDEAHNMSNLAGNYNKYTRAFTRDHPQMKLLMMTATPIYDKPADLLGLLALARRDITGSEDLDDPAELARLTRGLVSYYAGAPPSTYPETTIKYSVSAMSAHQTRWYLSQVEREIKASGLLASREVSDSFYSASRGKAIVVFKDGIGGAAGMGGMKKRDLLVGGKSSGSGKSKDNISDSLAKYSCKLDQLVRRLKSGKLSFVYSNFAGPNGVQFIVKVLRANGWKEYTEPGPGRSFAVFSGEETAKEKRRLRETFNSPDNDGGKKIQVVIGSPAIKEGVSFFRIRQVHILDPYWNYSRIEQVYGRASRYCSHKSLPAEKRKVSVYIYVSCVKSARGKSFRELVGLADPRVSIDALILGMAEKKLESSRKIMGALVAGSIDKKLGY